MAATHKSLFFNESKFYLSDSLSRIFKRPPALRISFLTCVKNRLSHLKETLAKNLHFNKDFPNLEFVILDYNSNDGVQDWLSKNYAPELRMGRIRFYRTEIPKYFEMAKAKNIVHRLATGNILCNLDADHFTGPDFATYLSTSFHANPKIVVSGHHSIKQGTTGRIALHRRFFLKLTGYDEALCGYGFEDEDLIQRCLKLGLSHQFCPQHFLDCIPHSDDLRSENLPYFFQNVQLWTRINRRISIRRSESLRLKRNLSLMWGCTSLC